MELLYGICYGFGIMTIVMLSVETRRLKRECKEIQCRIDNIGK